MVVQDHPACQHVDRGEVSIDTFSCTLDLGSLAEMTPVNWQLVASGLEAPETNDNHFLWLAFQTLVNTIFGNDVFQLTDKFGSGRNFFRNSIGIEGGAGFLAFGGNNQVVNRKGETETRHERIQIFITGQGCKCVSDWSRVYRALVGKLGSYAPKITRIDIAYDDHAGQRDVEFARDSYSAGLFAGNGRPPKGQFIDDMGSDDGRTMYVGSRESGRYLRVYEKGRQLGDKESEWVRWEVELSAKQTDIPLEVLLHPRAYLAGSYPCLDWISRAKQVIESRKKQETIEYDHLVRHGRRAYGSLVNYMIARRAMTPEQVVAELIRDGVPGRLTWTTRCHVEEPKVVDTSHLYQEIHTVMRPVDLKIDWEEKRKNHWSNIA